MDCATAAAMFPPCTASAVRSMRHIHTALARILPLNHHARRSPGLHGLVAASHPPARSNAFSVSTTRQAAASNLRATAAAAAATAVAPNSHRVIDTELREEAEKSYLAYAMSVIVGRALPDVRDGLKPVHRRILFAMHELGLTSGKPHRKCARVVGEVLGKYHPHGDTAVYNALVRLAQDFSMQAPLISGHGNFGSIDNDPAAAMRYTECRLEALSSAMLLADLDSQIIKFAPNFDESQEEPTVLPARAPNLLVNGSSGIAVGIATNIPPHNLREVVDGLCALIHNPDITVRQLMQHVKAPDFPTGGEILATTSIQAAYHDGRGSITVRGKVAIEAEASASKSRSGKASRKGGDLIVITELPYQTNKADLVANIADLVDKGTITGVADVRDESDRTGMRIVVEARRGSAAEVILNNLYKHTSLQTRFACNMVALVDGTPRSLSLRDFLQHFLDFRCEVVRKRAERDVQRARARLHLVQGFLLAMNDLDKVVATIRAAADGAQAAAQLRSGYGMSGEQAEGVLNLSLRRLTSLEAQKLQDEADTLTARIQDIEDLLQKRDRVLGVIEAEARELATRFGRDRRTALSVDKGDAILPTAVIPNDPSFVLFSKRGFIKRMRADTFSVQNRNGRGTKGATLKSDDSMEEVLHVMDHDSILFFTQDGVARSLPAHQIPQASRTAQGSAITQVLPISKSDSIAAMLPVTEFTGDDFLVMLTKSGLIKRTPLSDFETIRSNGLQSIRLRGDDQLRCVARCRDGETILLATTSGKALHLDAASLTPQSRAGGGTRAINVDAGAELVGLAVIPQQQAAKASGSYILFATAQGLGKRVPTEEFGVQRRGGKGVIAIKLKDGDRLVDFHPVGSQTSGGDNEEEVLFVSAGGLVSRNLVNSITIQSRSAKGIAMLNLQDGDEVQTVTPLRAPVSI